MAGTEGLLAAAVLKMALEKVGATVGGRIMLQWRFRKDLEYMRDTLESIAAVLEDAERRSIEDKTVQLWLERLTGASYDISDMFDEFEVNCTKKSTLGKLKALSSEFVMASKMKEVREKLERIKSDRDAFSFNTSSYNAHLPQVVNDDRVTDSEVKTDILGRDQEVQQLKHRLEVASKSSDFVVLPIYGMGGMGKTALAQLLFNDTCFQNYLKAWVYVSQTFDKKKIKDDVESQLAKERNKQSDDTQQQDAASNNILIILDDLWEEGDFKLGELRDYLRRLGHGSKVHVIATTRHASIAQKIQTIEAHKIDPLSLDVCWNIIKKKVDFEKRTDKQRLEDIGKEIAQKCNGVALAALALGYILISRDYDGWVSVKESPIWTLSDPGSNTSLSDNNVLASLRLSYRSMPADLRLCFAYCAIFPKGHMIHKDDLIYQWAALGFIMQSDEVSMLKHGENCIKQLLEMSFLQKSERDMGDLDCRDVTMFTMHDLVHDLARSIMGEEVFYANEESSKAGRKCRYALFFTDCDKPWDSLVSDPHKIRAIRFQKSGETGHSSIRFSAAKYLRVLDLNFWSLMKFPPCIGQLKLLRYLNAPAMDYQAIPNRITKLSKLIYLNLHHSLKLSTLPMSIGNMEGLLYLDLSMCPKTKILGESLGMLKRLVHLNLSNCIHLEGISRALCSLTKLQYLNLLQYQLSASSIKELHEGIGQLTELRYLNLSLCFCMNEKDEVWDCFNRLLDRISTLSNLKHLDLSRNNILRAIPNSFCNLQKLDTLDLDHCFNLKRLPEGMKNMKNLRFLLVSGCWSLDMSTVPINDGLIRLPYFVVSSTEGAQSSNLVLLKQADPSRLYISCLENVKSVEEARRIELRGKQSLRVLELDWTSGSKRLVEDDMELLRKLVPPRSLEKFMLRGYNSLSFPVWPMDIATCLPNLVDVALVGLSQCCSIRPLGQLPNLVHLHLESFPSITKIDRHFFGDGSKEYSQLRELEIHNMENLEEWRTTHSCGEGVADEFMFPNLQDLTVRKCRKLRVKPCPPRLKYSWDIKDSDGVLVRWEEGVPCSTPPALLRTLSVTSCTKPMHQWKLLRHFSAITELILYNCNDLSSSPEITQALISLVALHLNRCFELPHWLGDLTSLKSLIITECEGIMSFPESIKLVLTNLEELRIWSCPELCKWCETEENKTKIGHIKRIEFSKPYYPLPAAYN